MINRLKYLIAYITAMLHIWIASVSLALCFIIPIFWLTWIVFGWTPIKYLDKLTTRIIFHDDFWYDRWIAEYKNSK